MQSNNPKEFELEEYDELEGDEELDSSKKKNAISALPFWLISAFVHGVLLFALMFFIFEYKKETPDQIIVTSTILEEEQEEEEVKEIEVVKEVVEVVEEVIVQTPMVTEEVVQENQVQTENEMEADTAEGVTDAISDLPLVGSGLMGNIGGGGGGGGSFGQRSGGGRKKAVLRNGGSKKTESAVDLALWWLANHQEPGGHWDTAKWEGEGDPAVLNACTGAALLAFLGAGHTDKVGQFKDNVSRALKYLLSVQKPDGSFDPLNYTNGICAMALAEAHGMGCGSLELKKATVNAIDYILKEQNTTGGFNYHGPSPRDDMSVTGWCIMALKSALLTNIREKEIHEVFTKFGHFMDKQDTTTGDNTSTTKGDSWYQIKEIENVLAKSPAGTACGAIAMLMRQYLGWKRFEPWLVAAEKGQVRWKPKTYTNFPIYKVYYAYLSLFQQGGDSWKEWNTDVTEIILNAQRLDGDFRGSWDNVGSHTKKGGRVLSTALLCLSLEVYYRYKSVYK